MASEITRTVRVYKHTFGKLMKGDDGRFEVMDPVEVVTTVKMGTKLASQYVKDNNLAKDSKLISVEEVQEKYAMPVSKFMELATKIQ